MNWKGNLGVGLLFIGLFMTLTGQVITGAVIGFSSKNYLSMFGIIIFVVGIFLVFVSGRESRLVMDKLRYTDLVGLFRKVGREKNLGGEILKYLIYTDEIYGSDYVIGLSKKVMANPKSFGAIFPSQLGKIYAVKYFARMHKRTGDDNYLKAILDYKEDSDSKVRQFAEQAEGKILKKERV